MEDKNFKYLSRRVLVISLLCLELAYLAWRLFFTFNQQHIIYSTLFFIADVIIGADAIGFALSLWGLRKENEPVPVPLSNNKVDVWITTYNESIDILRRTVYHCVQMDFPHTTYVLDDGNRPEVKELALSLGAKYIFREQNTNAKAGNMNNALKYTDGDFIAIFDADFIPQRNFLTELLGYFNDPKMALVQTPQQYYNLNSFQHRRRRFGKEFWNEQITFFELVLSGRNHWNAASWIGTNAILRRAAVESVGGFATESVTEDMLTSMRIHSKGWRTKYVRKYLAFGLAPANLPQFITQRLRWSQGLAQIFRHSNPFFMKGLTFPQRFFYFSSIMHFFEGSAKFIYYLMPALFFLTGIVPIRYGLDVLAIIIIHPFFNILVIKLISRGKTSVFYHEIFAMARFFCYFLGNFMVIISKKIRFKVTPKQDSETFSLSYALGPGIILGLNLTFFLTAFVPLMKSQVPNVGVYFCVFLCGYFSVIAFSALLLCFSVPKLGSFIIYDYVPLRIQTFFRREDTDENVPVLEESKTTFWSDSSFGFTSNEDYSVEQEINCEFAPVNTTGRLNLEAKIIDKFSQSFVDKGNYKYIAQFENVDETMRLKLVDQVFHSGVYRQHLRFEESADIPGLSPSQGLPERKIKYSLLISFLGIMLFLVLLLVYVAPYRYRVKTWFEDNQSTQVNISPANSVVQRYGNLHVIGTHLCDAKGNPVQLKGISSHGPQWFPFVNNHTVKSCVDFFNVDLIRIAMYVDFFNEGEYTNGYLAQPAYMTAKADEMIQDAIDQGIYIILSWHVRGDPALLSSESGKFFRRMSSRWGAYPNIIFEICNEPTGEIPWSRIRSYAVGDPEIKDDGIIDVIRKFDPDSFPNIILVGTPYWCQWVHEALKDPINENNIMYTFHFYSGSHTPDIRKSADTAIKEGLPVFVSEWGTSRADGDGPIKEADIWIEWINENKLSWTYWSLSNNTESSAVLKPGVSMAGPWKEQDLSPSGLYLKRILNTEY